MTQFEKLFSRIKKWLQDNPHRVLHIEIVADEKGDPLFWFLVDGGKMEGMEKEPHAHQD